MCIEIVSLGLDENDSNKANFDVYKQHFETPFIDATAAYYEAESKTFLAENSVSAYMKKADERLREEEDRVERYLSSTTRKIVSRIEQKCSIGREFESFSLLQLMAKCDEKLIADHRDILIGDFQNLLDFDKDEGK